MAEGSLVGRVLAGRFRLLDLLGEGAVGEVYLAEHLTLPRRHAIKVLKPQFQADPRLMERFRREAAAASRLAHPNIVYITDFGQAEDGRLYLAMEHVDGVSLDVVVDELLPGVMPLRRALRIMDQLADALGAAHEAGIVHRDLKPENIMVHQPSHGGEQVKVLDFGLAKMLVDTELFRLTRRGEIFGTPMFMSPEQARGAELDHRTDIYSLGAVAYELLTGRPPFDGETVQDLIIANQTVVPPAPASVRPPEAPPLPDALDSLVMACMEKDRERRPRNMAEVRRAIAACRDGLRKPTSSYGFAPRSLSRSRPAVQVSDDRAGSGAGSGSGLGSGSEDGPGLRSASFWGSQDAGTAPTLSPVGPGAQAGSSGVDAGTAPTIGPLDSITAAALAAASRSPLGNMPGARFGRVTLDYRARLPPSAGEASAGDRSAEDSTSQGSPSPPFDRASAARMAVKDPWHFRQVMRCARAVGEGLAKAMEDPRAAEALWDTLGELSESDAALRAIEDELAFPTARLEELEQTLRERATRLRHALIDLSLGQARLAEDPRSSPAALSDLGFQIHTLDERLAEAYQGAGEATLGLQREVAALEGRRSDLRQERVEPELRLLSLVLSARGTDAAAREQALYAELAGLLGGGR